MREFYFVAKIIEETNYGTNTHTCKGVAELPAGEKFDFQFILNLEATVRVQYGVAEDAGVYFYFLKELET